MTDIELIVFSCFYNRACYVERTIKSVLAALPLRSIVVLINDGSTDNTAEVIENLFPAEPRLIVHSQDNIGFTKSLCKWVLHHSISQSPRYVAIHGAGDVAHMDKFDRQVAFLASHADVAAVGCANRLVSDRTSHVLKVRTRHPEATTDSLLRAVPFTHGTVMHRTTAYLQSGGYDPFFRYCQDWELYFRLAKQGRLCCLPQPLYDKHIMSDGASYSPKHKAVQLVYKDCAILSGCNEVEYLELRHQIEQGGAETLALHRHRLPRYLGLQQSLVKIGEFGLARQWCDVITAVSPTLHRRQSALYHVLLAAERLGLDRFTANAYAKCAEYKLLVKRLANRCSVSSMR